ncbi:hypothetical protein JRI60_24420 [Archangium violaceum]|uniref:hypothetical protein n=1 Tax=Archangium violaceum TaxID=83451 RepID=UPI00194E61F6|nr:hypothetical protein [Archangium violaceum]QRO01936.1 hypothetical protein JRI60_24420 [Archangium violaceum]
MWNQDNLKNIDVLGANLECIKDGFAAFTLLASRILLDERLGVEGKDGMVTFEKNRWYSLNQFLRAFERIGKEFGVYTLKQAGMSIPKNAVFPPTVVDIDSGIRSIDVAYHMNHGTRGVALFSPDTGEMREGIGHYGYERIPNKKLIVSRCDGPYPCAFDEGILTAMAQRFETSATVVHSPNGCRSRGAESCAYNITWR